MATAALLLAAGSGSRFEGSGHKLAAAWGTRTVVGAALANLVAARFDLVFIVTGSPGSAEAVADSLDHLATEDPGFTASTVRVIRNEHWAAGQATSLQLGLAAAQAEGSDAVIVGLGDQPGVPATSWRAVAASESPVAVARFGEVKAPPVLLRAEVWPLLPASGDVGARDLIAARPELVDVVDVSGDPRDVDTVADLLNDPDRRYVEVCLGRPPRCEYAVAARSADGRPLVIANAPFLDDGTPMPTRYWLIDPELNRRLGTLEADGGVNRAEAEIGPIALAEAHDRSARARDALIAADHGGPRPSGGVGGTRIGVKCLHTHYAWWLAGGDDPVGRWAHARLGLDDPEGITP